MASEDNSDKYTSHPYHYSKLPQLYTEKTLLKADMQREFEKELRTNPRYEQFFQRFDPKSVESFIQYWAAHKAHLLMLGDYLFTYVGIPAELRHRKVTEQVFRAIMQKKLFNLQCLWLAEQVDIPEIPFQYAFSFWEHAIEECPFAEPVTEEDVAIMKQYLLAYPYDEDILEHNSSYCLPFRELTSKDEDGNYSYYPNWYEFYDGRKGTGMLLSLPTTRMDEEQAIMDVRREMWRKEAEAKKPTAPVEKPEVKERLLYGFMYEPGRGDDSDFVERFEHPYIRKLYLLQWEESQQQRKKEYDNSIKDVDWYIMQLSDVEETVYMEGGLEWRTAIQRTWLGYLSRKVSEELDVVFHEYQMLNNLGMGKKCSNVVEAYKTDSFMLQHAKDLVIAMKQIGREIPPFLLQLSKLA